MQVLFRSPQRGESLALWLAAAVAIWGSIIAFVALTLFADSQVQEWDRQLREYGRPPAQDAPR